MIFSGMFTETFNTLGSVVFGLAIAGCVISCVQVWSLTKKVDELEKQIKNIKKGTK